MAIFDRLSFLEGDQADAYKAKKAKEEEDKEKAKKERYDRRYFDHDDIEKEKDGIEHVYRRTMIGSTNSGKPRYNPKYGMMLHRTSKDDSDRYSGAEQLSSEINKRKTGVPGSNPEDIDVISRNMRRHPDKWKYDKDGKAYRESIIFESVKFLNE